MLLLSFSLMYSIGQVSLSIKPKGNFTERYLVLLCEDLPNLFHGFVVLTILFGIAWQRYLERILTTLKLKVNINL